MGSSWCETKLAYLSLGEIQLSRTHSLLWIDLNIIMELLLVTFGFATTILFVPAGACGLRSPVPDKLREKRSASAVDPVDVNTGHTLSERAALAPVADEESEGGRFPGKRAAASSLVVDGSFAVGHGGRGKRAIQVEMP